MKCSNSGINESTPQTQSNVTWISSKADLKISFLNSLLKFWVWESGRKIDPATGVTNINICGRILTQFTGLLRTNTVAAKRDLLVERSGLGKSVSVSLRKNGPYYTNPLLTESCLYMGSRAPLCRICCRQIEDWHNWGPTTSYCLWPPCSPGYSLLFVIMIIGPQSGSPSAWSWFSISVEKVGVAPSGLGACAVRKRSLQCHGFRRTASLRTTSNRTTSRRTTSARKTSRLELTERSFGERFLENSFSQTAGLGEQLLGEQFLTNGSHKLRRWT